MATRYRVMLCPIGKPTGDGRRFAAGAIEPANPPFPLEWVRVRDEGHNGAVTVGSVDTVEMTDDAIYADIRLFDDVDPARMPRLAEDVATAMKLIDEGVLGPSVDLDEADALLVEPGTDTPASGEEDAELLITRGRIRAGTLVSIPAYVETSQLFKPLPDSVEASEPIAASLGIRETSPVYNVTRPTVKGPTQITWDFDAGIVYGHLALWGTCHAGFDDVCISPPRSPDNYAHFNRYPVETTGDNITPVMLWCGRLTVGGHHPGLQASASAAMDVYDSKTIAAYVHAEEDEWGIFQWGPIVEGLSADTRAILERRKVSGDWRETSSGLSLIEVLALGPGPVDVSEPGFPVRAGVYRGRQISLVASFAIPALTAAAFPVHHTETTEDDWGNEVENMPDVVTLEQADAVFAWYDNDAVDEDGNIAVSACKLPHHMVDDNGAGGAANMDQCSRAIAALNGARAGVDIPEDERRAAYDHLAAHLEDGDQEVPPYEGGDGEEPSNDGGEEMPEYAAEETTSASCGCVSDDAKQTAGTACPCLKDDTEKYRRIAREEINRELARTALRAELADYANRERMNLSALLMSSFEKES